MAWVWLGALLAAEAASPSLALVHDRDVVCVDAPAPRRGEPAGLTCTVARRADGTPPVADRWSWALTVQPPTRLVLSLHPPQGDWTGGVLLPVGRSVDPVLVTMQVSDRETRDVIDGTRAKERCLEARTSLGATATVCAPSAGRAAGEAAPIAVQIAAMPEDRWVPLGVYRPREGAPAADISQWFSVRAFVEREQLAELVDPPYATVEALYGELASAMVPVVAAPAAPAPEPVPDVNLDFLDE